MQIHNIRMRDDRETYLTVDSYQLFKIS